MTGSSLERPAAGMDGEYVTYCRICEALCGLVATVEDGKISKIVADKDNPHSKGHLCAKGPAMKDIVYDPDRVTEPLKRVGKPGEFEHVSWQSALDDIAARLKDIVGRHGPRAFATYLGNPAAFSMAHMFYAKGFMDAVGSPNLFSPAAQDTSSRSVASYFLYGNPALFPIPDLPRTDFLLVFGANPLVSQGSLLSDPRLRDHFDAIAERGRVIIVDPRRTATAARYEHLPIRPNSDVWLLSALLRVLLDESLLDTKFLTEHVDGWRQMADALRALPIDRCSELTGIDRDKVVGLARDFAGSDHAAAYGRVGICRSQFATLSNVLLDALNIVTSNFGTPGGSVFGYSALDIVKLSRAFAMDGYANVRSRIGGLPDVMGHLPSSVLADEISVEGEGRVRALMITAGNPVLSSPGGQALARAFAKLDLFFSLDFYVTESNKYAHYILPATTFLEREDCSLAFMSQMVRPFLQYTAPVIAPVGEARNEYAVFSALARRMGIGELFTSKLMRLLAKVGFKITPRRMTDLALRLSDIGDKFGLRPSGWSVAKLERQAHGVMIDKNIPDWRDRITHPDQRIRIWNRTIAGEFERLRRYENSGNMLRLFGRREVRSINSWMHNDPRLTRNAKPVLMMHPGDAAARGLLDGQRVYLSSKAGSVRVVLHVTDEIIEGSVCYPHGWGHAGGWRQANAIEAANINILASTDPRDQESVSGMSFLDGIPVEVKAKRVSSG